MNYNVNVVNKIGLIIRTDTSIITLGSPVLFDFFCYDPTTFNGVGCQLTMQDNGTNILSLSAPTGDLQKSLTFTNINTSYIHEFTFIVQPDQNAKLFINIVPYYA